MDIDIILSRRIHALRKNQSYSLSRLAELSGVSSSMISLIERAETSPTAVVLNKLAAALGVPLASLFADCDSGAAVAPVVRHAAQRVWTDPASGYTRRHLSPPGFASPLELAEVIFPAGQSVYFENAPRSVVTHQQIWMQEGVMDITVEDRTWNLQQGDCLAMLLGRTVHFRNSTDSPARYIVALTTL